MLNNMCFPLPREDMGEVEGVKERKNRKKTLLELEKIWRKKMEAIKILNTF